MWLLGIAANPSLLARAAMLAICLAVVGCSSTIPLQNEEATRNKLATDLQVQPSDIHFYTRCVVGKTRTATVVPRLECVYLRDQDSAAVLDYDPRTRKFSRAFTFDRTTRGVALQERQGLFGIERQLQIRQKDDSTLVVEFVNADLGTIGSADEVLAEYEHLQQIGITSTTPLPFVHRQMQPQPIYIPIYIPSR
jgi:hypothetical protein